MSMADRSEGEMTALVEKVMSTLVEGWADLPAFQKYTMKDSILPVIATCIDVFDAEPHRPKRGSDIEAWLRWHRAGLPSSKIDEDWLAIDALISDYIRHADEGTPLVSRNTD